MNDQAYALRDRMAQKQKETKKKSAMRIITVTSGKGGVGKSNFTINLALCMKELGNTPLILDADFGLANVEIILGERPKFNLGHYMNGHCTMDELICKSQYGIPFISGGSGVKEMLFLNAHQVNYIANGLSEIEAFADTLLIDTGAGINEIVMKFCEIAEEVIVIVTPEPASITDAYALIKTLHKTLEVSPKFRIVINKASSLQEAQEVFQKIRYVTVQFLGAELVYGGYIPYDQKLFESVKAQKPIRIYDYRSRSSQAYEVTARSLIPMEQEQSMGENWLERFKKVFSRK